MSVSLRPEVQAFAEAMELALRENEHKGGWTHDRASDLYSRLLRETIPLHRALGEFPTDPAKVLKESADVANFAMMIAHVAGGLVDVTDGILRGVRRVDA